MLDSLFAKYPNIVVLDTETTGVRAKGDEIIELAALRAVPGLGQAVIEEEMDDLIRLSPGRHLSPVIVDLTGITEQMLTDEGVEKAEAAGKFAAMISRPGTLVVAYNAQFDLLFLYYFLQQFELTGALQGVKFLDAMTVYKDRRDYPHKLKNAIEEYHLAGENTHRAIDDAKATLELLEAMSEEENDLEHYVNLFGYSAKYGVSGPRIRSITYVPQGYDRSCKLYEKIPCQI